MYHLISGTPPGWMVQCYIRTHPHPPTLGVSHLLIARTQVAHPWYASAGDAPQLGMRVRALLGGTTCRSRCYHSMYWWSAASPAHLHRQLGVPTEHLLGRVYSQGHTYSRRPRSGTCTTYLHPQHACTILRYTSTAQHVGQDAPTSTHSMYWLGGVSGWEHVQDVC